MSVKSILAQMLQLLKLQVDAVISGDHAALRTGAEAYEQLLAKLEKAEYDVSPDELRPLFDEIQQEKSKLQSLISVEANRVEFFMRLLVGSGAPRPGGYPGRAKSQPGARMLNRRA